MLANALTMSRVVFAPVLMLLYLFPEFFFLEGTLWPKAMLLTLVLLEISDLTDGWVARKTNSVSDFGKIVDPMADTLVHLSLFFVFTQPPISLHPLLVVPFFYREIFVGALRTLCAMKGYALSAQPSGKYKTALQAALCFFTIIGMWAWQKLWISLELLQVLVNCSALAVGIYTLYTAWDYFMIYRKIP